MARAMDYAENVKQCKLLAKTAETYEAFEAFIALAGFGEGLQIIRLACKAVPSWLFGNSRQLLNMNIRPVYRMVDKQDQQTRTRARLAH